MGGGIPFPSESHDHRGNEVNQQRSWVKGEEGIFEGREMYSGEWSTRNGGGSEPVVANRGREKRRRDWRRMGSTVERKSWHQPVDTKGVTGKGKHRLKRERKGRLS